MRFLIALSLLLVLLVPASSLATDYTSTNFKVKDPVVEELGGYATSSNFGLLGSIPYISPRRTTSTTFINQPGFLGFPAATTTTTSTTPSPPTGGGGGGIYYPPSYKPKDIPNIPKLKKTVDFNHDGFVNFIDFSILLYYFDKTGDSIWATDLNDDLVVDLTDVSIFMYYWDGSDDQKLERDIS
jgi:hypothetical protein